MQVRENFTDRSSSLLDTLINRAPSIAFLDPKKVCILFFVDIFRLFSFYVPVIDQYAAIC